MRRIRTCVEAARNPTVSLGSEYTILLQSTLGKKKNYGNVVLISVCVSNIRHIFCTLCLNTPYLIFFWKSTKYKFDIHGSVHRRWLSRNTNKMQPCNKIYYSEVYWRLNMFRAAHRSSSGDLNCICSLWFLYPCGDRPLSRLSALTTAGHHMGI